MTKAENNAVPPSISFEGRLPDPPIITCNESLPLRVLITKLNDSPANIYIQLIEIVLVSNTTTRAHELERTDTNNFVLVSRSNLHSPLAPSSKAEGGKEVEVDSTIWNQAPLPNSVAPTFNTCNVSCNYLLDIKVGLSWGLGSQMFVSQCETSNLISSIPITRLCLFQVPEELFLLFCRVSCLAALSSFIISKHRNLEDAILNVNLYT